MDLLTTHIPQFQEPDNAIWGMVVAVQANFYWVKLGNAETTSAPDSHNERTVVPQLRLLCTRRSRLKKIGQQVMVGDLVRIEDPDWAGGRGAIAEVFTRQTVLDRPPVANATQILLMFALADPPLEPQQLSRFLVKAESTGLQVRLCLNKQDLVDASERHHWQERLQRWGYKPTTISVLDGDRLSELSQLLRDQITVISGPSGVGKSSLINQLIPDADLRTSAVSGKLGRGRHTTRHVELFELPAGGFLADTPGFNQPDLSVTPEGLATCFPEIRHRLNPATCQFNDCLHRDEPGCAVGSDWERYELYLAMLEDALAAQEVAQERRDAESSLKVKVGEMGQIQHEPKLQAKKYRRVSRRSQNQALDELRYDIPESTDDLEDWDELGLDD